MTQVFSDSDAFARREIKIAVSEEGPVLAIDVVAHRLGWNFSLRQGPVSAIPADKRKALRSESVLVAAAQFIAQYAYLDRAPEGANLVAIDIGKAIEVEIDREAEYQARLVDMAAHPERYAALKQLTPEELRVVQSANAVHYVTSVEVGEDADLKALKDAAVAAATALSLAVKAKQPDPPPPARVIANDGDTAETTTPPAPAPATEPADAPSDPTSTGAPTAADNAEGLK